MNTLKNIKDARSYSDDKVEALREALASKFGNDRVCVGACGSYARREASPESDLDFFVICRDDADKEAASTIKNQVFHLIGEKIGKSPAHDGPFGDIEIISSMVENIGGIEDTNHKLTRRVLLLLEGDWLYNPELFHEIRNKIVEKYVRDSITDHQLALFLLNDIIRYYRTVCVDFEFKVNEAGKSWGSRNIKLVFSRKLLYYTGILMIGETAQRTAKQKREILLKYINMPAIDRVKAICGDHAHPALQFYDEFLGRMATREFRDICDQVVERKRHENEDFRRLKNSGHHFSWKLESLLVDTFAATHPIHRVLIL